MSTYVERNFRVRGIIDCTYSPPSGTRIENFANIEVQLWHQSPMQSILLNTGLTDSKGEFVIDIEVDSPVSYVVDGKIKNVFVKAYYNGELLTPGYEYDADAQLYFNQLTFQPSPEFKSAINTLVLQLKADDNWSKLDRLWIHATEYRQHARVSLVNPISDQLIEEYSPTWTLKQGYTGDGTSSYIKTNYIPTTDGVNHTLNNNSAGVYSRTNIQSSAIEMGTFSASAYSFYYNRIRDPSDLWRNAMYSDSDVSNSNANSTGLFMWTRTSASEGDFFRNGTSVGTNIGTSGDLSTVELYLLALNGNGTASNFSNRQVALSFIGSGGIDAVSFYDAVQTFATTIGFNL